MADHKHAWEYDDFGILAGCSRCGLRTQQRNDEVCVKALPTHKWTDRITFTAGGRFIVTYCEYCDVRRGKEEDLVCPKNPYQTKT